MTRLASVFTLVLAAPMLTAAQDLPQEVPGRSLESSPELEAYAGLLGRPENCRDTIQQVREESGLPHIQRDTPADPDEPILFRALDYDVDGCDVLLTSEGPRPLPLPQDGPLAPQPAQ